MSKCLNCQVETTNPKFCSSSCSATFNNKKKAKRSLTNKCAKCDTLIRAGTKYCRPCYDDKIVAQDMTLDQATYKHTHRASVYSLVRSRARTAIKHQPQICTNCGYDKHVQVCHIKPVSSFDSSTLISVINALDNLILLCPNCHWEFDHNMLSLEDIFGGKGRS